ncbi:hypothetical protein [Proteus mirabilis]|uniref:hypothetical protein n=1 Tax=Proteus mirabilis TaxID=584 RepID=UPI0034D71244
MSLNLVLGRGLESLEGTEETPVSNEIAVAELAAAIADRDEARAESETARIVNELDNDQRNIDEFVATADQMSNLQASMEHFQEAGLTQRAASLLSGQFAQLVGSVGGDASKITGSMESIDEDNGAAILTAGIEALEDEKKGLMQRAVDVVKKVWDGIVSFFGQLFSQSERYKARAEKLIGAAADMEAGKKEVKVSNKNLVLGKEYSKNLSGDYGKFKDFIKEVLETHVNNSSNWMTTDVKLAMGGMLKAATPADAAKHLAALNKFTFKGATTKVTETANAGIYRTDLYLGNTCVIVQKPKVNSSDDSASNVIAALNALSKYRITVRQAETTGAPKEGTTSIDAADVKAIANNVIDVMAIVKEAKDKRIGKLGLAVSNMIGSLKSDMNKDATPEMKKIHNAAFRIPVMANNVIADVPRTGASAAMSVSAAVMAACESATKAKEEKKDDK